MNAARLTRIGHALYGRYWKSRLSDALKIHPSTIRRWLAADEVPPDRAVTIEMLAERGKP